MASSIKARTFGRFSLILTLAIVGAPASATAQPRADRLAAVADTAAAQALQEGSAYAAAGRWEEARQAFDEACTWDPHLAIAHYNRGVALGALGRSDAAIAAYERARRLAPTLAEVTVNLGVELFKSGRAAEARAPLEDAVRLAPRLAIARHNLGVVLASLGHLDEAIAQLDVAARLDPLVGRHEAGPGRHALQHRDARRHPAALGGCAGELPQGAHVGWRPARGLQRRRRGVEPARSGSGSRRDVQRSAATASSVRGSALQPGQRADDARPLPRSGGRVPRRLALAADAGPRGAPARLAVAPARARGAIGHRLEPVRASEARPAPCERSERLPARAEGERGLPARGLSAVALRTPKSRRPYSYCSARIGSIAAARRAGR